MMALTEIWQGIEVGWDAASPPTDKSIALATRLLVACNERISMPKTATRGYWTTTCLFWDDERLEVEVFDQRCEIYTVTPSGTISIEEFSSLMMHR